MHIGEGIPLVLLGSVTFLPPPLSLHIFLSYFFSFAFSRGVFFSPARLTTQLENKDALTGDNAPNLKVTKVWVAGVLDANGDGTITKDQDVLGQAEYFCILRAGLSQEYIFSGLCQAKSSERAWTRQLSHVGTSTTMSLIVSLAS